MKSKKLLIIIPIIIAIIIAIILAAVVALLLLKNKSTTQPKLNEEALISSIVATNPELTEQEVKDVLYAPLTNEQQEAIKNDIDEAIEKMEVQGVPVDELSEEELDPENIPDNLELVIAHYCHLYCQG